MRFHRNIKMLRSQADAAPYVTVLLLLLMFVVLGSRLYTPGFHVRLPVANDLPGTDRPTVSVAVDPSGRLFFENQFVSERGLRDRLRTAATNAPEPLTLIVKADGDVSYDTLARVISIAREAKIKDALLATMPRLYQSQSTVPAP